MHPIERLRYVARASGADPSLVAREAAVALAEVAASEPADLLPACRRLIGRHVTAGALWWLSARLLSDEDPVRAAQDAAAVLDQDPTGRALRDALPDDATVLVVGWPDTTAGALRRRGDVEVLIADGGGEGAMLTRRLREEGVTAVAVPDSGIAAAACLAGVVILEAHAAGPGGILAATGSHAAAAVARAAGVPAWAVVPAGAVLPEGLWAALLERLDDSGSEPWDRHTELVPLALLDAAVDPGGYRDVAEVLAGSDVAAVAELLHHPH